MRIGELIYIAVEVKKTMFIETDFIRSDIFFIKDDKYIVLRLKHNKINTKYMGIWIILIAMSKLIYSVAILKNYLYMTHAHLMLLFSSSNLQYSLTKILLIF